MIEQDMDKFAAILTGVGELYGKTISAPVINIFWGALKNYDIDSVEDAVQRHITNPDAGQFMPKLADLIRMIEGGSKDAAAVAWSKVDEALRHIGTYQDIRFDDPIIMRVIHDMGGWVGFGDKLEDEWPFVANDFKARYTAYRSRRAPFDPPKLLIGRAGGYNRSNGFAIDPPVNYGSREGCLLVEQKGSESVGRSDLSRALGNIGQRVAKMIENGGSAEVLDLDVYRRPVK